MTNKRLFQSFAAIAALVATTAVANATPNPTGCSISYQTSVSGTKFTYDYETSSSVSVASGTISAPGTSTAEGGLTASGATSCANQSAGDGNYYGLLYSGGTSTAGVIELLTPAPIANYLLTVTISGTGPVGDIYQLLVNNSPVKRNGTTSLATSPVGYSVSGGSGGTFSTVVTGGNGSAVFLSVTDLLQQYLGTGLTYNLPGTLPGGSTGQNSPGALSSGFDPLSNFTLSVQLVTDPEPASLSIFALGSLALGAARRRQRAKAAKTAA
jgi:hypothetical protein